MRHRKTIVIALLAPLLFALGCEQSKVRKLAAAADGFAFTVKAFQEAEIAAYKQGLLENAEHVAIQRALVDVAGAGQELDRAIRIAQSRPQATQAVGAALTSLDNLLSNGVLHVKNPQARQNFQALIVSAKGFLATISAVLG